MKRRKLDDTLRVGNKTRGNECIMFLPHWRNVEDGLLAQAPVPPYTLTSTQSF